MISRSALCIVPPPPILGHGPPIATDMSIFELQPVAQSTVPIGAGSKVHRTPE